MNAPIPTRIVAEITRNWNSPRRSPEADGYPTRPLISQQFEQAIATNRERGYELESWQFSSNLRENPPCITETIIAVFVEKK